LLTNLIIITSYLVILYLGASLFSYHVSHCSQNGSCVGKYAYMSFSLLNLLVQNTIYLEGKFGLDFFLSISVISVGMKPFIHYDCSFLVWLFNLQIRDYKKLWTRDVSWSFFNLFKVSKSILAPMKVPALVCLCWPCWLLPHLDYGVTLKRELLDWMVVKLDFRKKEKLYYSRVLCPTLVRWTNKY